MRLRRREGKHGIPQSFVGWYGESRTSSVTCDILLPPALSKIVQVLMEGLELYWSPLPLKLEPVSSIVASRGTSVSLFPLQDDVSRPVGDSKIPLLIRRDCGTVSSFICPLIRPSFTPNALLKSALFPTSTGSSDRKYRTPNETRSYVQEDVSSTPTRPRINGLPFALPPTTVNFSKDEFKW